MPLNCPSGTVPLARLLAFSEVKFAPLPEKVPAETVPEKFGLVGSAPFASVPVNCPAERFPSRLLALLAMMA